MGSLIYAAMASLDGFVADERGNFDWAEPDDQVHAFINDRERAVGTYLYGRRMYEVMQAWETKPALAEHSATYREFAEILAGSRQGRVLHESADTRDREDPPRTPLRP